MKPNQSNLFSSNSPWKDGIEPVFQTGTFNMPYQAIGMMNRNNGVGYNQMNMIRRQSYQSGNTPRHPQQLNTQQSQRNSQQQRPSYLKEQFSQIFNQENIPSQPTPRSHFSSANNNNNEGGGIKYENTTFQIESAKVMQSIQNNFLGIITGIQNNIVRSVNSNLNHQLKKQRYLVKKKHDQLIQYVADQDRIRSTKFVSSPQKGQSPSPKQSQVAVVDVQNMGGRSNRAVSQQPFKNVNNEGPMIDIQLKRQIQSQQNQANVLNLAEIQRVKEYSDQGSERRREESINKNKPDLSIQYTNNNNNTSKDNLSKRNSQDSQIGNVTLKNGNGTSQQRGSATLSLPNQQNNKQTLNKKFDQLFEDTVQSGIQQSVIKNESKMLDEGNSLAYTLDDEISKNSVFFGHNRDSTLAFDQSKQRIPLSKNTSQIGQKNQFNQVEEVDLDDIDNFEWESKYVSNIQQNKSQKNSIPQPNKPNNIHIERSPLSDKYNDDDFELLDEDELEQPTQKKGNTVTNINININKPATITTDNKVNHINKPNQQEEDDDDNYKFDDEDFDIDDF